MYPKLTEASDWLVVLEEAGSVSRQHGQVLSEGENLCPDMSEAYFF